MYKNTVFFTILLIRVYLCVSVAQFIRVIRGYFHSSVNPCLSVAQFISVNPCLSVFIRVYLRLSVAQFISVYPWLKASLKFGHLLPQR